MSINHEPSSDRKPDIKTPSGHETAQIAGFRDRSENAPKDRNKYIAYGAMAAVATGAVWGAYEMGKSDNNEAPTDTKPVSEGPVVPGQGEQPGVINQGEQPNPASPEIPTSDGEQLTFETLTFEYNGEAYTQEEAIPKVELPKSELPSDPEQLHNFLASETINRFEQVANAGVDISDPAFQKYIEVQTEQNPVGDYTNDIFENARQTLWNSFLNESANPTPARSMVEDIHSKLVAASEYTGEPVYVDMRLSDVVHLYDSSQPAAESDSVDNLDLHITAEATTTTGETAMIEFIARYGELTSSYTDREIVTLNDLPGVGSVGDNGFSMEPYIITPVTSD